MKWRVMEFEDKEFLWLHLIWNLTPKNLLRVSCTASLPYTESFFFLGPHARNPSQFHAAPTNSRTEFFPAGGPSLLFSSLYDNYLPATTTDTWPRAIAKITLEEKSSERGREPTKTSTHMWHQVQELNGRTAHSPLLHPSFPVSISYQKNVLTFEMAGGTWYSYLAFYNGNVFTIVNKENYWSNAWELCTESAAN